MNLILCVCNYCKYLQREKKWLACLCINLLRSLFPPKFEFTFCPLDRRNGRSSPAVMLPDKPRNVKLVSVNDQCRCMTGQRSGPGGGFWTKTSKTRTHSFGVFTLLNTQQRSTMCFSSGLLWPRVNRFKNLWTMNDYYHYSDSFSPESLPFWWLFPRLLSLSLVFSPRRRGSGQGFLWWKCFPPFCRKITNKSKMAALRAWRAAVVSSRRTQSKT